MATECVERSGLPAWPGEMVALYTAHMLWASTLGLFLHLFEVFILFSSMVAVAHSLAGSFLSTTINRGMTTCFLPSFKRSAVACLHLLMDSLAPRFLPTGTYRWNLLVIVVVLSFLWMIFYKNNPFLICRLLLRSAAFSSEPNMKTRFPATTPSGSSARRER